MKVTTLLAAIKVIAIPNNTFLYPSSDTQAPSDDAYFIWLKQHPTQSIDDIDVGIETLRKILPENNYVAPANFEDKRTIVAESPLNHVYYGGFYQITPSRNDLDIIEPGLCRKDSNQFHRKGAPLVGVAFDAYLNWLRTHSSELYDDFPSKQLTFA